MFDDRGNLVRLAERRPALRLETKFFAQFTLRETDEGISKETQQYLNRLSDALFVWSRWINADVNEPEYLWSATSAPPSPL